MEQPTSGVLILARTGDVPVEFDGRLLAIDKSFSEDDLDRGYELSIYQANDGRWIAQLRFFSRWRSESNTSRVIVDKTVGGLAFELKQLDPLRDVVGYPPGKQFEEKHARLLDALEAQYDALLGRVLALVPEAAEKL